MDLLLNELRLSFPNILMIQNFQNIKLGIPIILWGQRYFIDAQNGVYYKVYKLLLAFILDNIPTKYKPLIKFWIHQMYTFCQVGKRKCNYAFCFSDKIMKFNNDFLDSMNSAIW